jgi:hypothetical protein
MTNYFFLSLDIPLFKPGITQHDLPKEIFCFIDENTYLSDEIISFFLSRNISMRSQCFYKKPIISRSIIHVDRREFGDYAKINWIIGGGDSKMCWFTTTDKYDPNNPSDTPCLEFKADEVSEIERAVMRSPVVVQSGIPHCVLDVTEERWCVSVELLDMKTRDRITMEEAKNIFSDLLI